ncbi:MAG: hypothetical protein IJR93_13920, partial [Treponema sp.]|nr:hypothetical protein [Treponema sp.]
MTRLVRFAGSAVLSVSLLSFLSGCGKGAGQASGNPAAAPRAAKQAPGVSDVLAAGMAEEDKKADKTEGTGDANALPREEAGPAREAPSEKASMGGENPAPVAGTAASGGIDVDLTVLS